MTERDAGETPDDAEALAAHRVERLIERLPPRLKQSVRWLRKPSSRWARIPAGLLFCFGRVLWMLPVLGLWMLPLGILLLADDIAPLRRGRTSLLERLERQRPQWFAAPTEQKPNEGQTPPGDRRDP